VRDPGATRDFQTKFVLGLLCLVAFAVVFGLILAGLMRSAAWAWGTAIFSAAAGLYVHVTQAHATWFLAAGRVSFSPQEADRTSDGSQATTNRARTGRDVE
jgi:hypothetical protein